MKKVLLTLLTSCLVLTSNLANVKAEEQTITKSYLKETLGMSDEQIIAAGLAFVYDVYDTITLPMSTLDEIDAERVENNFTIPENTNWEMEFEVVANNIDAQNSLQLISKDALPIGLTSIDDGTNEDCTNYSDMWVSKFLNDKVLTMFDEGVQNYILDAGKNVNELTVEGETINDIAVKHTDAYTVVTDNMKLWIPSAREVGLGSSYSITQGTLTGENMDTLGKTYAAFKLSPKANVVKYDGINTAGYLLREDFHTNNTTYFLCTGNSGLTHTELTDASKALVFGMNICWSNDTKNGTTINEENQTDSSNVSINAHVSSTYAVDLPETVTLTKDFTQFDYEVSGDLEEGMKVMVDFPTQVDLVYNGTFSKDNIDLNVFNSKVVYTALECYNGGKTGHVSIKNEIPSAGNWTGNLPVTIGLSD